MILRNIATMLSLVVLFTACKKEPVPKGNFSLRFYPRVCTQMVTLPMQAKDTVYTGPIDSWVVHFIGKVENNSVDAKKFILWMMTGTDDLKPFIDSFPNRRGMEYERVYHSPLVERPLAERIPSLERQLDYDYRNYSSRRSTSMTGTSNKQATNLIPWEYRVTGVKDFKIVALSTLFGQPAGTTLNRFFSIHSFEPRQVISYRRKNLLWGYSDKSNLTNLAQWLSMEPMAPPIIMFQLNSMPQELPKEVQFVSTLETMDGKILRDTVQIHLK